MIENPSWYFDEFNQVGIDYSRIEEVEAYDARYAKFRNVVDENNAILDALKVQPDHILIEIGTGTGAFAIQAACRCKKVIAIDISLAMLAFAKKKAADAGIRNISFSHGGFLTYEHTDVLVDGIVTSTALHHLPDFWKAIALRRLNKMLKPGGQLFISDVVFKDDDPLRNIAIWLGNLEKVADSQFRQEAEMHIREEFSTLDWIMDGLLDRSGFKIVSKKISEGVMAKYLCIKES